MGLPERGWGRGGRERVCRELGGWVYALLNIFFPGRNARQANFGPQKKVYVSHFMGESAKMGTHINFFGGILGAAKKGVPDGPFWATKSLVYCSFPALNRRKPRKMLLASFFFSLCRGLIEKSWGTPKSPPKKEFAFLSLAALRLSRN